MMESLMVFLSHELEGRQHRILAENGFAKQKCKREINKPFQQDEPTAAALLSSILDKLLRKSDWVFCHKPHNSQECRNASEMSLEKRKNVVKQAKCCLLCFKKGHFFRDCRSKIRCTMCNQCHHVILCWNFKRGSPNFPSEEQLKKETLEVEEDYSQKLAE